MGDTSMTIEFLRARLLSERAVSRSAKQRADELADRVVELEEQLKFVSLQRMKAEKATSDVIAILETHGFSDNSEGYDSSSDQASTNGNSSTKNIDKSRSVDHQGLESPKFSSRSLSWKSSKCLSHACEKKFVNASSRRNSSLLSSDSSSPKHRPGKSCRQNKHCEMRSQIAGDSKLSRYNENPDEILSAGDPWSVSLKSPRKLINSEHHFHIHEGDREMERAMEHQAKLICRYEDEENARIEWEEKYKETNSSTPESFEPGNQSDVTEERDELKRQPPCFWPVNEDANSKVEKYQTVKEASQYPHPAIDVPLDKIKQVQGKAEGSSYHPPSPAICQFSVSNYTSSSEATAFEKYNEGEACKTPPRKHVSVSHEPSKELGSILTALQRAKLSLQHKLKKVPLSEDRFMGKALDLHHVPGMSSSAGRVGNPVTCASPFRSSTILQDEANVYMNYLDSRSQSSSMHYDHISASAVPANDQFKLNPQAEVTRSNVSECSSFDLTPNRETTRSSLGRGNQYAPSRVHSNRSFSSSDLFKFNPRPGTPTSTHFSSDVHVPSPYRDYLLTSDLYRSSSQLSCFIGVDQHVPGAYFNRVSISTKDRREWNPRGEAASSSLIDNDHYVRNSYHGSRLSMPSHNSSSGSPQPFSLEPCHSHDSDVSLTSHARYSYT